METSLFVGNLPEYIDQNFLRNYFIRAGNISDIYIPGNQKANRFGKYGFVRFCNFSEAMGVLKRCNGDFVWGRDIVVSLAKRERKEALVAKSKRQLKEGDDDQHQTQNWVNQSQTHCQPDTLPSKYRTRQWTQTGQILDSSPTLEFAGLHHKPKEIVTKWLSGCAVGYLLKSININALEVMLKSRRIHCSVIHMGGKMVLLSFLSEELMKSVISEYQEWFLDYFDYIKPWEENDISKTRYVWLKCENVPLHAWNEDFFRSIGDLYGCFEAIDLDTELRRRLDHGKILVCTSIMQFINRKHRVMIDGKVFEILITEDSSKIFNPATDMQLLGKKVEIGPIWIGESHRKLGDNPIGAGNVEAQLSRIQNLNSKSAENNIELGIELGEISQHNGRQNTLSSPYKFNPPVNPESHNLLNCPQPNPSPKSVESSDSTQVVSNPQQTKVGLLEPPSSPASPQIIPESPLDSLTKDAGDCEGEFEDISLEENFDMKLGSWVRYTKRKKKAAKRKSLQSILRHGGGGKLLKTELAKQSRGKGLKNKSGKLPQISEEAEAVDPGLASVGSLPEDISNNRSEFIRKTAQSSWALGKMLGMTSADGDEDATLKIFEDSAARDWDEFERQQNE